MNMNQFHTSVLANLGANVVGGEHLEEVETAVGLRTLLQVLEAPRARDVGAVLEALTTLARRGDVINALVAEAPEASPQALRRFGYLSDRLLLVVEEADSQNHLSGLGQKAQKYVKPEQKEDDWLALDTKLRRSDRRLEKDALHHKWRVLSPPDVWEAFVHECSTKPKP